MQNVNFTWLRGLLSMKSEPGPFFCLSELLEFPEIHSKSEKLILW